MEDKKSISKWILILSAIFSLMEILVCVSLWVAPESMLDTVDLSAKGVDYVIKMWATRQFALGIIFGFATLKKSAAMLTITYIFFLVMFVGDFVVGFLQHENALIISAVVMCIIASAMLYVINKRS